MSINQRELARRAVRLRSAIDRNITMLNWGGCGVFAVLAAKALMKLGIKQVEIVLPTQGGGYFDFPEESPRSCLEKGDNPEDMDRGHVGVRYILNGKTYCMDSTRIRGNASEFGRWEHEGVTERVKQALKRNGAVKVTLKYPFGQGLTVDEFRPCANKASAWNRRFDRSQIKKLKLLVEAYLVQGVL